MLQPAKPISTPSELQPTQLANLSEIYSGAITFLHRQFPVIILIMLVVLGFGLIYLFTAPPRYTGVAVIVIDTKKNQLFQQQSLFADAPIDSPTVDTQIEILKSENVALSVIKDLHLLDDKEFMAPAAGLVGTLVGAISGLFGSDEPASESALTRGALRRFQSDLNVKRLGLTYAIEISFRSGSPEQAARIANAVADAYVVDSLEAKYQTTRRAATWLQDRLRELRQELTVAEQAVLDFKVKNDIVDTGGRLLNEQQLAELNSALTQARAQTAEAKARLDRVSAILNSKNFDPASNETATVADALRDEVVGKLRSQYIDLATREANWSRRYGRDHLAAVNLRNQMQEISRSIAEELRRLAETYKSDFEIAKSREDAVQKSLSEIVSQSQITNQAQIQLRELQSRADTYRALNDNFLQRYMESVQQQSFPITETRVITKASPPTSKSSPKTLLILAVASMGGLFLGLGVGLLRDVADRVYRTSAQIEADLGVDCLAVLPKIKPAVTGDLAGKVGDQPPVERCIVRKSALAWSIVDSPFSRFAESIRSIKVAIDLQRVVKPTKIIAVTSSLPNEGKSTIASSLAQLIAYGGSKVLLVDCDLRNPSLTRQLAPAADRGILDVLNGSMRLEDAIWTDPSTNLIFLPAVATAPIPHSSEILSSDAVRKLFEDLRERFEYVIVDLSPLAPVVDVRATTHLIDSFVFVVEWGRTKIDVVEHALGSARGVYENLLGVVLNKADINILGRYESYRGNYYRSRYYERYGYTE
ncbi:exopolysaccharide biosynthesis protein [Bradyrhizobium guangdongense]|uniref:polysaccharide biosynthesis tyrosine autokinase n=1 Tax=Bradyrhizobium guangdongense TaxID=1325090 RepID=UPI00112E364B|nr:polysaccharide biosynthesis tyrosine autokinase [Bradyrhizobium guangdongense]TPQ30226.1 exopolysaccharide biosynthesis protein [Bradyrhizobium guangdongense]